MKTLAVLYLLFGLLSWRLSYTMLMGIRLPTKGFWPLAWMAWKITTLALALSGLVFLCLKYAP